MAIKVVTPEEMSGIDRKTIEDFGIPSFTLMESAGRSVYSFIRSLFEDDLKFLNVAVVVGKGNNGGDGLVVARYLMDKVSNVDIFLLSEAAAFKGDARKNFELVEKMGINLVEVDVLPSLEEYDLIVDAIFGTGFRGQPDDRLLKCFEKINLSGTLVISVDIPSGVSGETGEVIKGAVVADYTITMGTVKRGHLLYPGKAFTGELYIADIGIPESFYQEIDVLVPEVDDIKALLPVRIGNEHKGNMGRVLVVAGATGFTGAASLASQAAIVSGAGLVYLAIPEDLNSIMEVKLTEVITLPYTTLDNFEKILNLYDFDVVAFGPGLGRTSETVEKLRLILDSFKGPLVIDADGIWALSNLKETKFKVPVILTPHPGEAAFLLKKSPADIDKNRIEDAALISDSYNATVVLKGAPTIIKIKNGNTYINPTGNPGMASGGVGDVLTGMIAGFIAQGISPEDSALISPYIHGFVADLLLEEESEESIVATKILENIGKGLNILREE